MPVKVLTDSGIIINGKPVDNREKLMVFCQCHSPDHQFGFEYFNDDDNEPWPTELYFSTYLAEAGFFRRVLIGLAYIFGHKSKYGPFDEVVMSRNQAVGIKEFLDKYLEFTKEKADEMLSRD